MNDNSIRLKTGLAEIASEELGEAMRGLDVWKLSEGELLQTCGW